MSKIRVSTPEEMERVYAVAPKRAPVLDYLCKRDVVHDKIVKKGNKYTVSGLGTSFKVTPPYKYGQEVFFMEKFRVGWWNKDFDKAVFCFADGRSITSYVNRDVLASLVETQVKKHRWMTGKSFKKYRVKHFDIGGMWHFGHVLPRGAARMRCRVTWVDAGTLWDMSEKIMNMSYIGRGEFATIWDKTHKGGGCSYDVPALVWSTDMEVLKYRPGLKNDSKLAPDTRLPMP